MLDSPLFFFGKDRDPTKNWSSEPPPSILPGRSSLSKRNRAEILFFASILATGSVFSRNQEGQLCIFKGNFSFFKVFQGKPFHLALVNVSPCFLSGIRSSPTVKGSPKKAASSRGQDFGRFGSYSPSRSSRSSPFRPSFPLFVTGSA